MCKRTSLRQHNPASLDLTHPDSRQHSFQKAVYPGDRPNLRFAITGEPTVHYPHCRPRR
jgi:hypothetical protein